MMSSQDKAELEVFKSEQVRKAEEEAKAAEQARLDAAMPKPVELQPEPVPAVVDFPVATTATVPQAEGQSEPLPMEGSGQAPSGTTQMDQPASPIDTRSEPATGKYFGKRYHDWNYYVPLSAWLAGGGTEEDYNWRPAAFGGQR